MHFVRVMGACSETALVCSKDATEGMSRILHILSTETVRSVLELWYESRWKKTSVLLCLHLIHKGVKLNLLNSPSHTLPTVVFSGNTDV